MKWYLTVLVLLTICFLVGLYTLFVGKTSRQGFLFLFQSTLNASDLPPALEEISDIVTLDVASLLNESLELSYHRFMNKVHFQCLSRVRLGHFGDGGWDVCVAGSYKPKFSQCLVYSFGINYDFSFDDDARRRFRCVVKSFDPTMDKYRKDFERENGSLFFSIGLWGKNTNKTLRAKKALPVRTLGTILQLCRDEQEVIDVLKMDIEGSEWEALDTAMDEGVLQKQVKQLAVEFHNIGAHPNYRRFLNLLSRLESEGFRKWQAAWNMHCRHRIQTNYYVTFCYEVYYLNLKFLDNASTP